MADFKVELASKFLSDMEEALIWLYDHNLQQSEEFANKKSIELEQEVNGLKDNLKRTPYIGQADEVSEYRRFPLYEGRFVAVWSVTEKIKVVRIIEFLDAKYPKELRYGKSTKFDE